MLKKYLNKAKAHLKSLDALFGVFSLIIFIAASVVYINKHLWYEFFWLSNHWALINGIGFLTRSKFLFSYVVVLGIIPEIFWVMDFLLMIQGHTFLGITSYWFDKSYPFSLKLIALQHLINPFVSIYGIARFGFHKKAWIGALIHGTFLLLISLMFFSKAENVNCVWRNCFASIPMPDFIWKIILLVGIMVHIWLVTYLIKFIITISISESCS